MTEKDMIHMTTKDLKRLHFIKKAIDSDITQKQAAEACGLSERQTRRIIARIRKEGEAGIIHKSRGKPSHASLPKKLKERVLTLHQTRYPDFGPTLASEKLWEKNKIKVHPETLRRWFLESDIHYKTRKKRPRREWRERKAGLGEMIQMDGSHHDWLEGRGPWLVLMGYIDDATGHVFARFYDYEGTLPAMDSFYRYVKRYGIPQSVYLDKHSTYKSQGQPTLEEELQGLGPRSQFERALEDLGVEVIHAHSAPAKGRIERLFGIFQDRLVKELRLHRARTKDEANRIFKNYLPKYNRRFNKVPRNPSDLHRRVPPTMDLRQVLSIQTQRTLNNDNTVRHGSKLYLIRHRFPRQHPHKILVQERLDGRVYLTDQGRALSYREVKEAPPRLVVNPKPKPPRGPWKRFVPPKDHIYRQFVINPFKSARLLNNHRPEPVHEPKNSQVKESIHALAE